MRLCLLLLAQFAFSIEAHAFRVAIDPGHGGADFGAVHHEGAARYSEKELTLRLSQQIASELKALGIEASLTRDIDQDLALPKRTAAANALKADVFISIHLNSSQGESGSGVETYILNNTTDATSKRLAELENSGLKVTSPALAAAGSNPEVALILKDLRLDGNLADSKRLACLIQSEVLEATTPHGIESKRNRGIKQALFYVLLGADMPSVLVEAGFLNHPKDRAYLSSFWGRKTMARSIAHAVDLYRKKRKSSNCKVEGMQ